MPKKTVVDDETLIQALLTCSTQTAAAEQCGISTRQLYQRKQGAAFLKKLHEAQSAALSGTVRYLQANTATAAETLVDICQNGQEQNRLTAARTLLEQAARLTEVVDIMERLDKLEGMDDD